ncbi:MAG: spore cortex biosynthesis protein YabQ [Clostridia bacterium]|nr:spore cortex biosynthesis protein YabQ [Clostridia bacterium]
MWEIDNSFQLISFLVSCGFGVIYCLLYDLLRAVRKVNEVSDATVFLQDIIYFFVISIATFMLLTALSNGEVRGYIIIGLLLGFLLCFCTFSKINLKILTLIFEKISFLGSKIVTLINTLIDAIWRFFNKTVEKIGKLLTNVKKIFKNLLKKSG